MSRKLEWELSCSIRMDRQTGRETSRRTDRHDEANSRFSQLCQRAYQDCYSNAVTRFAVLDVMFQHFNLIRDHLILSICPRCSNSTAINQLTYESYLQFLQYLQHPAYVVYMRSLQHPTCVIYLQNL